MRAGLVPARYSAVAIALHWIIAALILLNLYLGLRMGGLQGVDKFATFQLHKSVGLTVLAFSLVRLGWRLLHPRPPYPATMKPWEKATASTVHWTFYALMIAMPLTGWIIVSASPLNLPTLLYRTVPVPHLGFVHDQPLAVREAIGRNVGAAHGLLAWLFMALILLHVGAALMHQVARRDGELYRMVPFAALRR